MAVTASFESVVPHGRVAPLQPNAPYLYQVGRVFRCITCTCSELLRRWCRFSIANVAMP
jgi:hypothetical protein